MATPPPSQFAVLLRRSKFASYDPRIGQVYTAFDGHAARGNFGLKRPLALRRRNAHITVQAVDSREQQTVWRSAESENRWIRMWEEIGVKPTLRTRSWGARVGMLSTEVQFVVDSEFAPGTHGLTLVKKEQEQEQEAKETETEVEVSEDTPRTHAIPNLDAMSHKEFQRYLVWLRELRPAFLKYVTQKHGTTAAGGKTLLRYSVNPGDDFREFLSKRAFVEYHTPRPRYIEQQPHRFGGLSYTHTPNVQLQYTTKPHIGRKLAEEQGRGKLTQVVCAGNVSQLSNGDNSGDTELVSTFRVNSAYLSKVPATVGPRPQGLDGVRVTVALRSDSPDWKSNVYAPGSKEYVATLPTAHTPNPVLDMTKYVYNPNWVVSKPTTMGKNAMDLLATLKGSVTYTTSQ
ncbi:mitochondrial ribosomal protein subunit-domain-containing protein [Fomes fomentarius]|nr:mitochondrial ribosomal protein subunit-domain-containing protein [Fomes fomentarius]